MSKSKFSLQSIRLKIIGSFLLIIAINSISGYLSYESIKRVSELVNITYDKALMAATFSQAAKFNFSRMDSTVKSALLAQTNKDFQINELLSQDAFNTLIEDLDVVDDRNLDKSKNTLIFQVKAELDLIKNEKNKVLAQKSKLMEKGNNVGQSLTLFSYWENLDLKKKLLRKVTAIHDDAAELGYLFRIESDKKNKEAIKRSLIILISCLLFSLAVSFVISFLIIRPLFKLQKVCQQVNEGDFTVRSNISRGDEFGELSSVFDFMLNTIQEKTENITSLLAALPFGLFYVDKEGKISNEKSPATTKIFPEFEKYNSIEDFFYGHGVSAEQIKQVLGAAFGKMLPFKAALGLLPNELTLRDEKSKKYFAKLSFEPNHRTSSKDELNKVIILAEDVSFKKKAEKERDRLFERVDRISKVSNDIDEFQSFVPRAREILESCVVGLGKDNPENLVVLKRDLHTIKGLFGLYSFTACSKHIHDCENLVEKEDWEKAKKTLNKCISLYRDQVNDINEILNLESKKNSVVILKEKLIELDSIIQSGDFSLLSDKVRCLSYLPFSSYNEKYQIYLNEKLKDLPGKAVELKIESGVEVSSQEFNTLNPLLVHLLNNSLAHGIETSDERRERNKPESGSLIISLERTTTDGLWLVFKDDGNGIDGNAVLVSALEKGTVSQDEADSLDEEDKQNLIFKSGFSTLTSSSTIAGRGVGMDVVKSEVEALGGNISLATEIGQFCQFTIEIPKMES